MTAACASAGAGVRRQHHFRGWLQRLAVECGCCAVLPLQWDAPDIDNIVFLSPPESPELAPLEVGQMRRCRVVGNSIFDLEAVPIA